MDNHREDNKLKFSPDSGERKSVFAGEIWFTAQKDDLQELHRRMDNGELTATVRLGDRSSSTTDPKGGYGEGRYVALKIQKPDLSFDKFQKEVVITSSEVKMLGDIIPDDLRGTFFEGEQIENLKHRLEAVYRRKIGEEEVVTMVRFKYQDGLRNAADLLRDKVISLAKQPRENPENLNFNQYTLPLLEHDYPAKTAAMWNEAYKTFYIETANAMAVGNPQFTRQILEVLQRDPKYIGGGVGVGFKDEAIKYLDELDETARAIGSVNFILKTPDGKLRGYNTDGAGYAKSLEELFRLRGENLDGKKIVILGAGGTGNAVAFALAEHCMKIVILNRTVEKAKELAERINHYFGRDVAAFGGENRIIEEIGDADAIINVSTKGSAGELERYSALMPATLPATEKNIQKNLEEAEKIFATIPTTAILSDIVLGKKITPFLRAAKEKGFTTLDGVPMVVNQGIEAFWILHGRELEAKNISKDRLAEIMKKAAYEQK